jgi:hypothetical protein
MWCGRAQLPFARRRFAMNGDVYQLHSGRASSERRLIKLIKFTTGSKPATPKTVLAASILMALDVVFFMSSCEHFYSSTQTLEQKRSLHQQS